MRTLSLALLIGFVPAGNRDVANLVPVVGTGVAFRPPDGFVRGCVPDHWYDGVRGCDLLFREHQQLYADMSCRPVILNCEGVEILREEPFSTPGATGTLSQYRNTMSENGPELVLHLQVGRRSLEVTGRTWGSDPDGNLQHLRKVLETIRWNPARDLDPREGKSFTFADVPGLPYLEGYSTLASFWSGASWEEDHHLTVAWDRRLDSDYRLRELQSRVPREMARLLFGGGRMGDHADNRPDTVTERTIAGLPAVEFTQVWRGATRSYVQLETYIFDGEVFHSATGTAPVEDREEFLRDARRLVDSLRPVRDPAR